MLMPPKGKPPSIQETSFECPYCGVFTTHTWLNVFGKAIQREPKTPIFPDSEFVANVQEDQDNTEEAKQKILAWAHKMDVGDGFLNFLEDSERITIKVENIFFNVCFDCKKIAIWIHDNLVFPPKRHGPPPNSDLPDNINKDYEEASSILQLSPRGASALLRLCIQNLCIHLGEKGENLDTDIGSLVKRGLDLRIQKALDIVRVIGNESVHPGEINLNDDPDSARELFVLVNLIADRMISQPKRVDEMYEKLPPTKRDAIEKRDK